MKNILSILVILFGLVACEDNSRTKYYEFIVENQLSGKTVKIVPKSKTDFWISSSESYVVTSGNKIIIGSKVVYDDNFNPNKVKKYAPDIYQPDDIIAPFDVYIDDKKIEKSLSIRKYWDFSLGKVNESGKYTLIINENVLKD